MSLGNKIEERFVAFLDILGFKAILKEIESDPSSPKLAKLESVLNFMDEETYAPNYSADLPIYENSECGTFLIEKELGDPRLTYISDCIIISSEPTLDGFKALSRKIHKITAELAIDGIFCRGGISKGTMYHHGRILFGSAYLRAFYLEEEKAKFPRIILDPDILNFFDLCDGKMPLAPTFYGLDIDGYYYQRYWTWFLFPPYVGSWTSYLLQVRTRIADCLDQFQSVPSILEKYEWVRNEFNSLLDFWSNSMGEDTNLEQLKLTPEWQNNRMKVTRVPPAPDP